MDGSVYIGYLINKRVRRKVHNIQLLEDIYSRKYAKWIKKYLNENQITQVPLAIICNTLYKMPDAFKMGDNSFFIIDYALFDYFYDWNYILGENIFDEYIINLCLKQYIESNYRLGNIDIAYCLAITTDNIESYKDKKYFDQDTMIHWTNRTDIQEAMCFFHEANHYLLNFLDKNKVMKYITNIYDRLGDSKKHGLLLEEIKKNPKTEDNLFQECFCDARAIEYMLEEYQLEEDIPRKEYYALIYRTLFYIYVLSYINFVSTMLVDVQKYYDYTLYQLSYRMGNVYSTIIKHLLLQNQKEDIEIHKEVYEKYKHLLIEKMEVVRKCVGAIGQHITQNSEALCVVHELDDSVKRQYLKEYLVLL